MWQIKTFSNKPFVLSYLQQINKPENVESDDAVGYWTLNLFWSSYTSFEKTSNCRNIENVRTQFRLYHRFKYETARLIGIEILKRQLSNTAIFWYNKKYRKEIERIRLKYIQM